MQHKLIRGALVALCALLATSANATRLTPSIRIDVNGTTGARSTSVSIPNSTTWAIIAFVYNTGVSGQDPTSVSLDGQTAVLIDSVNDPSTGDVASYKVPVTSTGAGKTLAWTNVGTSPIMTAAIEFRDGTPTYGAHGNGQNIGTGAASTASLANSSGDEILTAYVADTSPTLGSGQSKLDETRDSGMNVYFGFTTESATGAGDVQSITGTHPAIASVVVSLAGAGGAPSSALGGAVGGIALRGAR